MAWPRESRLSVASSGTLGAALAATNNPTIVKSKHVCPLLKECAAGMMESHRKLFVGVHEKIYFDIFSANRARLKQNS